jgi:hypothetical protein
MRLVARKDLIAFSHREIFKSYKVFFNFFLLQYNFLLHTKITIFGYFFELSVVAGMPREW